MMHFSAINFTVECSASAIIFEQMKNMHACLNKCTLLQPAQNYQKKKKKHHLIIINILVSASLFPCAITRRIYGPKTGCHCNMFNIK